MLTVAYDARAIPGNRTGIGWYSFSLLQALLADKALKADVWSHSPTGLPAHRQLTEHVLRYPDTVWLRRFWEQFWLPAALQRKPPDLWHSPMTLTLKTQRFPSVVTVHDIAWVHFPEIQPKRYRRYWTTHVRRAVTQQAQIITPSHATRNDLLNCFAADSDLVHVVPSAADPFYQQPPSEEETAHWIQRLNLDRPFLLYVGTLEPRKNTDLLLEAWLRYSSRNQDTPLLAIVGGRGWLTKEAMARLSNMNDTVRVLGYLPAPALRVLYSRAMAFLLPSLYEGFGLPVLEAMACGTPCLLANTSSLPEVAGQAAVLLPPDEIEAWTMAIEQIVADQQLRQYLSHAGRQQASRFSWHQAAKETIAVYHRAMGV